MPHFKCLACKTRLQSTESPADPIGVCGSLLEPVGDLGENRRVPRNPSHRTTRFTAAHRAWARSLGASARCSLDASSGTAYEPGSESKAATLILSAHQCKLLVRALGHGRRSYETRRAPASAARPRLPRVIGAAGRRQRGRRRLRKVRTTPLAAGHAATWARLSPAG